MLLYHLVRPLAALSLRNFYGNIDIVGRENIPKDRPVILAANHPTTFIEPCIMACFMDRPLHFLVRGDFFKKPIFAKLLRNLHMLPVYRMKDGGYQNIKQNYETFRACFEALSARKTLMILAEGRCIHEKRLRPLRKGVARIALGALDHDPAMGDVLIVPVGVNYTHAERTRSTVMIRIGEPMSAAAYLSSFREQPNQAISQLTEDLADRLREHVIHVANPADDTLAENLLEVSRSLGGKARRQGITHDGQQLAREKSVIDGLNQLATPARDALQQVSTAYFNRLYHLRLDDAAVAGRYREEQKRTGGLALGLLPAALIGIWHLPPLIAAQFVAGTKIKEIEFYQPVHWATLTFTYLVYLILWLLVALIATSWIVLAITVIWFVAGAWALRHFELTRYAMRGWRARRQTPTERSTLQGMRQSLVEAVQNLK